RHHLRRTGHRKRQIRGHERRRHQDGRNSRRFGLYHRRGHEVVDGLNESCGRPGTCPRHRGFLRRSGAAGRTRFAPRRSSAATVALDFCVTHYFSEGAFPVALERTFAIIKPDAVSRGLQGEILSRINKAGFQIVAIKSMRLTKEEAGGFYAVHKERPFFGELTDFMSSGKIFAMVLEAEDAILKWRA